MSQTLKLKRSATPGKIPLTTDLELGEVGINTHDGKVFIKKDDGTATVIEVGKNKFGSEADYTEFEADGTMVAHGAATVWKDILPTAIYTNSGGAAPNVTALGGTGNIKCQEFPNENTTEEYNPSFQLPHEWVEGTSITPHLHCYLPANGATAIDVKFMMIYRWENVNDPADTEHTVYATHTIPANAVANPNAIISFGAVDGTGKKISSILSAHIIRESNANGDTFSGSVWLRSADLHVECNTIGSRNALTK